jgi:hypothetical protein
MPSSIINNGGTFFQPGVYSSIIVDRESNVELGAKNLAVVGAFPELKPNDATTYKVLRGYSIQDYIPALSTALKQVESIWKNTIPPELSPNASSSTSITYINAQQSTQATKAHRVGSNYGAQDDDDNKIAANQQIANFRSKIWGRKGVSTNISFVKSAGSNLKVIGKALNGAEVALDYDTEYNDIMTLTNKSGQELAIRIQDRKLSVCKSDDIVATPHALIAEILLEEFETIGDLFNALIATNLFGTGLETDGTASQAKFFGLLPKQLDELRGAVDLASDTDFDNAKSDLQDVGLLDANMTGFIKVAAAGTVTLTACTQGIIDLINVKGADVLPFDYLLLNENKRVPYANQPAFADLFLDEGGGEDGDAPDAADYETALAACVEQDFLTITCLSSDIDVHLKLKDHIAEAITASRFRNGWCGTEAFQALSTINGLNVNLLNSPHLSVVGQSLITAKNQTLPPIWTALFMMCMQGALPVGEPLTRKIPNIVNTEELWNRDRKADIEEAIRKGVVVIHKDINDDFRIARGITTYKKDNLSVNCEVSARESANYCVLDLQKFLLSQIGSKVLTSSKGKIESLANSRLIAQRDLGFIKDFRNVKVTVVADTAQIEFDLAVVEPLNFIKITANVRQF